ncbi:hypothetical protein M752DRAFT_82087 [Aspergillus phoenicis ATCC 13157]|uniref:Uncharacterized protein n=1 Tax=Aspergillus phoenicis ATCC 13157 TaxID=1353007 RepID=A0A370P7N2_ASPPH|nr:hypothetical protein M752DRAFT_82087 [Aspergillus phoenicis ATCC 13157]
MVHVVAARCPPSWFWRRYRLGPCNPVSSLLATKLIRSRPTSVGLKPCSYSVSLCRLASHPGLPMQPDATPTVDPRNDIASRGRIMIRLDKVHADLRFG